MKRLLALLLTIVMLASLLAGCGDSGNYTTLKCVFLGNAPSNQDLALVTEEMNKITREKLGVELDITILDAGSMGEKLNVMMGSGDQIDIVWTGFAFDYERCVGNGGLYDITELIEQTPGIKEHVPDYALNQCYVDGQLYGVPNMQILSSYWCFVFPKALVDKYEIDYESITCHDELEPYLEVLVQNEPDIYPIADSELLGGWTERKDPDEYYYEPYDNVCINVNTGEISLPMDIDHYVERWERAQEWYNKGYIRKDIMTVDDYKPAKVAGQVGVWAAVGKPDLAADLSAELGYEVVATPCTDPVLGDARNSMLCVGSNTVDALKSLQVIELLNTDADLHNLAVFGVEGTHYNLNADGKVEMVKDSGYDQSNFSWAYGDQFISHLMSHQEDDLWKVTKELNDAAEPSPAAGLTIPAKVQDKVKTEIALLSALGGEYSKGLRFGTFEDLDAVMEEYRDRALDIFYEIEDVIEPYVEDWIYAKEEAEDE